MWLKASLHHRHPANLRVKTEIKAGNWLYGPVNGTNQSGCVLQPRAGDLHPRFAPKTMQIITIKSAAGAPLTSQTREKARVSASLTWDAIIKSMVGDCPLSQRKVSPVHHPGPDRRQHPHRLSAGCDVTVELTNEEGAGMVSIEGI